ncbi:regulatory iron-sulfur-containing complex subunit RicT [Streptococcus hongkongensis]|nr:signal peptidase II [Streptococcus uberis]
MTKVIGVKYAVGDLAKFVKTDLAFPEGTEIVVKDGKGSYLAKISHPIREMAEDKLPQDIPVLVRKATDMDTKANKHNAHYAKQSKETVKELIAKNSLDMKIVDIVFPLERSFVLITFTAQERVDFRQLLRDLATLFKTRIELKQINSREEAKIFGAIGPCGRPLCCSSFLGEFPAVSIKMLKNQGLSLNSGKSTGYCGRLLCCLQYEDDFYKESKLKFPDYGEIVHTKEGLARVEAIDIFQEVLKVKLENNGTIVDYPLEEVKIGQ